MTTTSKNHMLSLEYIQNAIHNVLEDQKCSDLHSGSCNEKFFQQFLAGCSSLYKMYLIVHLVPFLLFKRKKLIKNPTKELKNLIVAFVKSLLFAGGYSAIVRRSICFYTKYFKYDYGCAWIAAIIAGVTLNLQSFSRQSEISLFCLNKTMETLYNMGLRRKLPVRIPYGQFILMGIAIGVLCYHYQNHRESIRPNYLSVLDKLISQV